MLHLTNGDSTAEMLAQTDISGPALPWRDILHDGPVPATATIEDLARIRSEFLASLGFGAFEEIHEDFGKRDTQLQDLSAVDELVLWFEHDLYDQLQILQVLDRLVNLPEALRPKAWSMICIGSFPGISKFTGLGQLRPSDLVTLFSQRSPLSSHQLALGQSAWRAFCKSDPRLLQSMLKQDLAALPFLKPALERHFQQYPSLVDGLSQTEWLTLQGLQAGLVQAGALFRRHNHQEPRPFLGDWSYWQVLIKLSKGPCPAISLSTPSVHPPNWASKVDLTPFGEALLNQEADFVRENGVDQWHGGVHLLGHTIRWRWDRGQKTLVDLGHQTGARILKPQFG